MKQDIHRPRGRFPGGGAETVAGLGSDGWRLAGRAGAVEGSPPADSSSP